MDHLPFAVVLLSRARRAKPTRSAHAPHVGGRSRGARPADPACSEGLPPATTRLRDSPARAAPLLAPSWCGPLDQVGCHASRSMRPRIWPKRRPCQVAFCHLEDEVSRTAHEASAGLKHALLQAGE